MVRKFYNFIMGALLFPGVSFANGDIYTQPHDKEERQLYWKESPLPWVAAPAIVGNLVSAGLLLRDYRSPEDGPSTLKTITAYTVLGMNGFPLIAFALMECPGCKSVEQVPMTDAERTRSRQIAIRLTYFQGIMQMVFSGAMYLEADKKSIQTISGITFFLPPVFALIKREKFKPGPARESAQFNFQVQPMIKKSSSTLSPGVLLSYQF